MEHFSLYLAYALPCVVKSRGHLLHGRRVSVAQSVPEHNDLKWIGACAWHRSRHFTQVKAKETWIANRVRPLPENRTDKSKTPPDDPEFAFREKCENGRVF
jgi:hypothetical protein